MDFSIFEKKKAPLNETCEIIVVDFVNKKEVYRTVINNLAPVNPQQMVDIKNSLENVKQISKEYIEKSNQEELLKNQEKQEFSA